MFNKSYGFLKKVQDERFGSLKESIRQAKKEGDTEAATKLKIMFADEREWQSKQRQV